MIAQRLRRAVKPIGRGQYNRQYNRAPSAMVAYLVPWATIALASIVPGWPIIASAPIMPAVGYLFLLGWRQVRPGVLPVWAGLPLGLVDDLFSGQPMGSAILLWSVSMLALDAIELRFPWRHFLVDWLVATGLIVAYGLATAFLARTVGGPAPGLDIVPQILLGVLLYPFVGRIVASLDRLRLMRFRVLR